MEEDDSDSEKIDKIIDSEFLPLPSSSVVQPENSPDVDRQSTNTSSSVSDTLAISPSPATSQPVLIGQENALTQSELNNNESITVKEPNSSTGRGEVRPSLPPLPPGSGSGSGRAIDKGKRKLDSVYDPFSIPRPSRPLGSSRSSGVVWPPPPIGRSYTPFEQSSILSRLIPRRLSSSSGVSIRPRFGTRYTLSELPGPPRQIPRPLGRSSRVKSVQPPALIGTSNNNPPPFVRPAIPRPYSPSPSRPMPTPPTYDDAVEAAVTSSLAASNSSTQNENVDETPPPGPREDQVEATDSNAIPESHESSD